MEINIIPIFPTPIYLAKLNRLFSKKEINFVQKQKNEITKNEGNFYSKNTYVLEKTVFKNLKNEILFLLKDYYKKIICPKNNIEPFITQSWLNYTGLNEYHHVHNHPNSYVSGVIYFNSPKKIDSIKFSKRRIETISVLTSEYNQFNSFNYDLPIEAGNIVLFPSSLEHSVKKKEHSNERISLAFNSFLKGKIGCERSLTELTIT
jgi:uncharacterized protein (TIGR02466 family)